MRRTRALFALLAVALATFATAPARAEAEVTNYVIESKAADGIQIALTVFKPAEASAESPAPVIVHSHGWAGSRTTSGMAAWTDAGFGVVSFDQRGHGETGGQANVEDPDLEGQDVSSVIDFIATLDWVQLDAPGDPVLGAIGGSYGGGYQTIGALTEVRDTGATRFNALAPEITWNDLPRSLAPSLVPRTLWDTLLYAVGAGMMPDWIHPAYAYGTATATFPDGTVPGIDNLKERFYAHSPAWFSENGYFLDIPVLFGQGISDNLFPLNEAWHNYTEVLTDEARARSILVGYNGGHVLPSIVPTGIAQSGDPCSGEGGFGALSRAFFTKAFAGEDPSVLQPAPYNLATAHGECVHVESLTNHTPYPVGVEGTLATAAASAGAPIAFKIADGPLTVAGIPVLRGSLTTAAVDARAFFALSIGTSEADAQILQNNVMPLRQLIPAVGEELALELPGVAVEVPEGQSLFLTVAQVTDMFIGTGSRAPGAIVIESATVDVPLA
jgi:pimeloyl-ACP methyl ester carboxylesterase